MTATRISDAAELKALETARARHLADILTIQNQIADLQASVREAEGKLLAVDQQIETLKQSTAEPIVSEHALLQYLVRAKGVNLDTLRAEILDGRKEAIQKLGSGKWKTPDGLTIVVKNRTVVTVYSREAA